MDRGQQFPMRLPTIKRYGVNYTSEEAPHLTGEVDGYGQQHPDEMWDMPSDVQLHTSQESVDTGTLKHFREQPNDPNNYVEAEGYDAPQVYHHDGKYWISEGHHRVLASRMRGDSSTKVMVAGQ